MRINNKSLTNSLSVLYTINIRGKQSPKDTKMVRLEMIFFKTGYARVPRVINITGLLKD